MEKTDRKRILCITGLLVLSVIVAIALIVFLFKYRTENECISSCRFCSFHRNEPPGRKDLLFKTIIYTFACKKNKHHEKDKKHILPCPPDFAALFPAGKQTD
jgi:hypothetical protein